MRNRRFNKKRGGFKCGRDNDFSNKNQCSVVPPQKLDGYTSGADSPSSNAELWRTRQDNIINERAQLGGGGCCSPITAGSSVNVPTMPQIGPSSSNTANSSIKTLVQNNLAANAQSSCDAPCNGVWPKHCTHSFKRYLGGGKKTRRKKTRRRNIKRKN